MAIFLLIEIAKDVPSMVTSPFAPGVKAVPQPTALREHATAPQSVSSLNGKKKSVISITSDVAEVLKSNV